MKTIWILTKSYNDYNQHGDYFVAAFDKLPTERQLRDYGVDKDIEELLNTKQTNQYAFCYFELKEVVLE
jgi:hypothetical protein